MIPNTSIREHYSLSVCSASVFMCQLPHFWNSCVKKSLHSMTLGNLQNNKGKTAAHTKWVKIYNNIGIALRVAKLNGDTSFFFCFIPKTQTDANVLMVEIPKQALCFQLWVRLFLRQTFWHLFRAKTYAAITHRCTVHYVGENGSRITQHTVYSCTICGMYFFFSLCSQIMNTDFTPQLTFSLSGVRQSLDEEV